MIEFFIAGGIGMYAIFVLGFLLIAASTLFFFHPQKRSVPLIVALGISTLGSGLLNFSLGLMNTSRYLEKVEQDDQFKIAMLGLEESLHNVVLALIFIVLAGLISSTGAFRWMRRVDQPMEQ